MGPPAGPRRRLRLAIVLIWLVTLVGAEVASRLVLPAPGFQPWVNPHVPGLRVPHAIRGFANAPNFSGRRVTSDYEHGLVTNELGMRDEPFDDRRPGRRILAVGDSFTEGLGVERERPGPSSSSSDSPPGDPPTCGMPASPATARSRCARRRPNTCPSSGRI